MTQSHESGVKWTARDCIEIENEEEALHLTWLSRALWGGSIRHKNHTGVESLVAWTRRSCERRHEAV